MIISAEEQIAYAIVLAHNAAKTAHIASICLGSDIIS
jgi:hypothetical protein